MSTEGQLIGEPTTLERQLLYVIPIPGETTWARESYAPPTQPTADSSSPSGGSAKKREREGDNAMEVEANGDEAAMMCEDCTEGAVEKKVSQDHDGMPPPPPVVPAPKEVEGACLVKVYEESGAQDIKICDGAHQPSL